MKSTLTVWMLSYISYGEVSQQPM